MRLSYLFLLVGASLLSGCGSESFTDHQTSSLSKVAGLTQPQRHEIIDSYVEDKDLPSTASSGFYSCLSQMIHTKSGSLPLKEVMTWCQNDYDRDPASLNRYVNFDDFEKQFSPWDGSQRELERIIKTSMHDEDSYEHIKTTYRLIMDDNPRAIVTTQFKGKNGYGGIVKQQVMASVDIGTGQVLEIIQ